MWIPCKQDGHDPVPTSHFSYERNHYDLVPFPIWSITGRERRFVHLSERAEVSVIHGGRIKEDSSRIGHVLDDGLTDSFRRYVSRRASNEFFHPISTSDSSIHSGDFWIAGNSLPPWKQGHVVSGSVRPGDFGVLVAVVWEVEDEDLTWGGGECRDPNSVGSHRRFAASRANTEAQAPNCVVNSEGGGVTFGVVIPLSYGDPLYCYVWCFPNFRRFFENLNRVHFVQWFFEMFCLCAAAKLSYRSVYSVRRGASFVKLLREICVSWKFAT